MATVQSILLVKDMVLITWSEFSKLVLKHLVDSLLVYSFCFIGLIAVEGCCFARIPAEVKHEWPICAIISFSILAVSSFQCDKGQENTLVQ
jgi:hypothetical protein